MSVIGRKFSWESIRLLKHSDPAGVIIVVNKDEFLHIAHYT